jgi:hypothetical protein
MISRRTSPRPLPWESLGYRNPELAHLFGAAFRKRRLLAAWYPWVPAPPARVGSPYCRSNACYPVGALIRLWRGWDYLRGPCPECGGSGLGFVFAGALSSGCVTGVCGRCATMLTRFVPGIGAIMGGIRPVLEGTPFSLTGLPAPTTDWAPLALVAALGELGESGLPDPRSHSLTDYQSLKPRGR